MEGQNSKMKIGECICLEPPYKHFIISSLEESIQNRDKDIDIIKKTGEDILKIKGIKSNEETDVMIEFYRSTKKELTKVINMVHDIPSC